MYKVLVAITGTSRTYARWILFGSSICQENYVAQVCARVSLALSLSLTVAVCALVLMRHFVFMVLWYEQAFMQISLCRPATASALFACRVAC